MARDAWFRNTTWSAEIEAVFQQRLRRARHKSQYLRIQAVCLAESHPNVSLRLLNQYFALGDHFDMAQAYVDKAGALIALGDVEGALSSYEAALQREAQFPSYKTQAYLNFPCLVAEARIERLYLRALEILDAHRDLPRFPIDRYRANGARALLLDCLGKEQEARRAARLAMTAAGEAKSGFRYHQHLGLVRGADDPFDKRITELAV